MDKWVKKVSEAIKTETTDTLSNKDILTAFYQYENCDCAPCIEFIKLIIQRFDDALDFIPSHWMTPELYLMAVKTNPYAFEYVPKNERTEEMALLAVNKDGTFLEYVNTECQTLKVCKAALENNFEAVEYIHKDLFKKIVDSGIEILMEEGEV